MTFALPSVVHDMPDTEYHADPVPGGSLSSSDARRILECPAKYHYDLTHPRYSGDFDFGHAAHLLVLGVGPRVEVIDAKDWRTKAAQEAKEAARADGMVPMLAREWEAAQAMADGIKSHTIASRLLDPTKGKPEVSLFWVQYGVELRCRYDWLPDPVEGARPILVDYKTTTDASNAAFGKSAANFGYHQQAAWYIDAYKECIDLDSAPAFVFIVQERTPPYVVNLIELDPYAMSIGRARNKRAIEIYRECRLTDRWPGYSDGVEMVGLPRWAEILHEIETETDVKEEYSSW